MFSKPLKNIQYCTYLNIPLCGFCQGDERERDCAIKAWYDHLSFEFRARKETDIKKAIVAMDNHLGQYSLYFIATLKNYFPIQYDWYKKISVLK